MRMAVMCVGGVVAGCMGGLRVVLVRLLIKTILLLMMLMILLLMHHV